MPLRNDARRPWRRHNGVMTWRAAVRQRVGAAAESAGAYLRRRTGDLVPPSRWARIADTAVAVGLAAATWYTADNPVHASDRDPWLVFVSPPGEPGLVAVRPPPVPVPPQDGGLWATGDAPILTLTLAALCVLPVAWRRRFPLAAYASVMTLTAVFHALYDTGISPDGTAVFTFAAVILTAFSAVQYSPYRNAALVVVGCGTALLAALYETNVPAIEPSYVPFFVVLAVALAINALHGWKQRLRSAEAAHRSDAAQALRDERARIARELHDVVTHHVSVMVIQAGAARVALDGEPDHARAMLRGIETSGKEAMTELRDMVGLLTDDEDSDDVDLSPQPGLAQLDALVTGVRAAGVDVQVTREGEAVPVPAGIDLAVYRVAQEALTNTMKHAAGARARVTLRYSPSEIHIEVIDSGGSRRTSADAGSGRGLMGLSERLAVYDGILDAGPQPGGGFAVRATIPLVPGRHDPAAQETA